MSKVPLAIALVTEALAALCQCDVRSWLPYCVVEYTNTLCYIHFYFYDVLNLNCSTCGVNALLYVLKH